tara:strand:- start:402 stop:875 length:474 start_codon:yes stop_codon:yes gene_type:complete
MASGIVIVDIVTRDEIQLQNVPKLVKHKAKTKHNVIRAMGANNPKYHYTGAEDLLSFTTTFYCDDAGRADVVEICRKMEALTKNDGYAGKKHEVLLVWYGPLYSNHRFLFMEVEYTWKQFNGEYDGYPMCAEVSMKFARVTTGNLTHDEIRTTITPT